MSSSELFRRQLNRHFVDRADMGFRIDRDALREDDVGAADQIATPKQRFDAANQFENAKRFGEIIIGADVEADNFVELRGFRRNDENRRFGDRRPFLQLADDRDAVNRPEASNRARTSCGRF
ncbi:MAG: hypothetical protein MZU97_21525 [Bacillus subtilis]|nr:hypothetical protein [Bacillus subtilis]